MSATPPPTAAIVEALKLGIMDAWGLSEVDYGQPLTEREAPNATIDHEDGQGPQYDPQEDAWAYSFVISGAFPMVEGEVWATERDNRFAELLQALIVGPALGDVAYLPYLSARFPTPGEPRDTYIVGAVLTCRASAYPHH